MTMSSNNVTKFKEQIVFLINQINGFTHSEQLEILGYIKDNIQIISDRIGNEEGTSNLKNKNKRTSQSKIIITNKVAENSRYLTRQKKKHQIHATIPSSSSFQDNLESANICENIVSNADTSSGNCTLDDDSLPVHFQQNDSAIKESDIDSDNQTEFKDETTNYGDHVNAFILSETRQPSKDEPTRSPEINLNKNEIKLKIQLSEGFQTSPNVSPKASGKRFTCPLCCKLFISDILSLVEHLKSHTGTPQSCRGCRKTFKNAFAYKYHKAHNQCLLGKTEPLPAPAGDISLKSLLICPYCGESYSTIFNLRRHMRNRCITIVKKNVTIGNKCEHCDQVFVCKLKYQKHKKQHKNHQCDVCEMSFPNKLLMKIHTTQHQEKMESYKYECNTCKVKLRTRALYREHIKTCGTEHRAEATAQETTMEGSQTYWCKICQKSFSFIQSYQRHLKRKRHLVTANEDISGSKPYMCEKCGADFWTCDSLTTHNTRMHTEKAFLFCEYCPFRSTSLSNMTRHRRTHKGNTQRYACHQCPALLTSSSALKVHFHSLHSNERKFVCDICSKAFKLKTQFNRHRITHSTTNSYCCSHCPMGFKRKTHLKRHIHSKHKEHIPKDFLAKSVIKFNKPEKRKSQKLIPTQTTLPAEVPMHEEVFSLIDVQSGELVTLSVAEMSKNAVLNMTDGDLLTTTHIPDLWSDPPGGLYPLDPALEADPTRNDYLMAPHGGPQVSEALLKTLHGHVSKDTMQGYIPHYMEIAPHKSMDMLQGDYSGKPDILTQSILNSDLIAAEQGYSCAIAGLTHLSN